MMIIQAILYDPILQCIFRRFGRAYCIDYWWLFLDIFQIYNTIIVLIVFGGQIFG